MYKRLILTAVIIVVIGAIGWRYLPGTTRHDQTAPPMVNVVVPDLDAALRSGEAAFNENCAACHGLNAAGQQGVAPPLVHIIYEPSHHGDQAFLRAALQGVPAHHWRFGDMPPVEGITPDEVARIVTYVRALQRANGIR